jgi:hypothetical protein
MLAGEASLCTLLPTIIDQMMIKKQRQEDNTSADEGCNKLLAAIWMVFQHFKEAAQMDRFSTKKSPNVWCQLGMVWWDALQQCHHMMNEFADTKITGCPSILPDQKIIWIHSKFKR